MADDTIKLGIDDIDSVKKKIEENASDDEKKEPGYLLYSAILETSKEILNTSAFVDTFNKLKDKLGESETSSLLTILSLAMTHSAYNAIQLYDTLLIEQLNNTVSQWNDRISSLSGTVNGHHGALEVFSERISRLEKYIQNQQH